jgi:parallel beta-helix repeat protein
MHHIKLLRGSLLKLSILLLAFFAFSYKKNASENNTNNLNFPAISGIALASTPLHTYYVSPTGSDTNTGTIDSPFLTVQHAQSVAVAGDMVYLRGGTYSMSNAQISNDDGLYSSVTYLNKSGTASAPIEYSAYPGEKPIFDFSSVKPANRRVTAFLVTGSYIYIKGIEIIGVRVTITTHTQSECFRNEGSNNIYEACKMHDGMGIGFYLTKGGNNLILNCDAYNNWDNVSEDKLGGNTDGFGCHPYKQGAGYTGNVFRGCRAWFNSDDGYDCINAFEAVTFENCWAFYNGYSQSFQSLGNGNGFKVGGFGVSTTPSVPATIPRHTVRFCLSVGNKANGFYANHHLGGNDWYNNTAYKNAINYNMLNRSADYTTDVAGYGHTLKNNLSYSAVSSELSNINQPLCTLANNWWQISGITISDADFVSTDQSLMSQGRHSDFTLPTNNFLRLVSGSDLIDKGVNLGFTYTGASPDLGCFEYGINKSPIASGSVAP